ncbi:MAG: TrkH family potassium uptake protein [Aerococcus sp.]|nr:TrkH family potassium uptake protein [Aerococcus sp.]
MNARIIRFIISRILYVEAALMAVPLLVGVIYREPLSDLFNFFLPLVVCLILGKLLAVNEEKLGTFYYKEALLTVGLVWVVISAMGAIPLWLTPTNYPTYTDAFFEMVSGFTTTGASVANDVEALPHSILFWRSFSHFIGGMGVLVFALALFPKNNPRSSLFMKAEVPGPIFGKLVPKLSETARILYIIYLVMAVILVILLMLGGLNLFDALIHAMGTAGTGGFSNYNASVGQFHSKYVEIVLSIGMFAFGINFNLYYYALVRSIKDFFSSEELKVYFAIVALMTILIAINIWHMYDSGSYTAVSSLFAVTSIISTTGFVSADFGQWPMLSRMLLITLMFTGACAGSTAGGFKVSRVIIAFKKIINEVRQAIDPKHVSVVTFEEKPVLPAVEKSIGNYTLIYGLIVIVSCILISLDAPDLLSTTGTVMTAFNNIGPGLGAYGPLANFKDISMLSKWVIIVDMLLGRLEIYPILILFSPSIWRTRRHRPRLRQAKAEKMI